jgi:FixJ family two-component response regulator
MMDSPLVCIVDDDESVRESLPDLLTVSGFQPHAFASAEAFLASNCAAHCRCLVLDIAMPVMSGPELQLELRRRGHEIPIVVITAHADDKVRQGMLDQGAVECLFKPFSQSALIDAINSAILRR